MDKRKVILDCDIGCDDALALIALLKSDKVDLQAITCVKGNLNVEDCGQNALKVAELCGKDIPVYLGCPNSMVRQLLPGRFYNTLQQTVHKVLNGEDVLIHQKSFDLPNPTGKIQDKHACTYLVETLLNTKEKIDICAVGPLTNLGVAITMEPKIVENIGKIYIMGGGLYIGNRTPVAEANFYDDPEAAEIVLNSGANCVVCPIEACEMGATYGPKEMNDIGALNNDIAKFLVPMMQGYIDRCNYLFDCDLDNCCIYDLAAVLPLIDDTVVQESRYDIAHVDCSGGMSDGQLVIDRRGMFKNNNKVEVIYKIDSDKLHSIFLDLIK